MKYPTVERVLSYQDKLPSGFRIDGEGTKDEYKVRVTYGTEEVGYALFHGTALVYLIPQDVWVKPEFRRQGIATEMYRYAEAKTGRKIIPADEQTGDAQKFWDQPARPFGDDTV